MLVDPFSLDTRSGEATSANTPSFARRARTHLVSAQLMISALAAAASGCTGELELRLLTAGFDDPLATVSRLTVEVLDADFAPLASYDAASAPPAEVGTAEPGSGRRVRVTGRGVDGGVVATGCTRPLEIDGASGAVLVPFAGAATAVAVPIAAAVRRPPVVDGLLDEWAGIPSAVLDDGHRVAGPPRPDVRAELLVGWDFDQLRFAVRVIDRCAVRRSGGGDGCQPSPSPGWLALGVDGGDSRAADYGLGAFMVMIRPEGIRLLAGALSPEQLPAAFGELGGVGWVVEGAVELAALGRSAIAQRDRVGLELAVVIGEQGGESTVLRLSGSTRPPDAAVEPAAMATLGFGAR